MDRRVRRVPDPEWELMYRRGLSRGRIADLVRAPARTIAYHLAAARAEDPGLEDEHAAAAGTGSATVPSKGRERMDQLIALVRSKGQYPSSRSPDLAERTLAGWLGRRRREAAAGTLAPAIRDGLACLPDWQEPARAAAGQARWQARLAELAAYREAGNDWPRHKNTDTDLEHALGVWLHSQRINLRRGELDPTKVQALDAVLPG
jgi:hypothetical protein